MAGSNDKSLKTAAKKKKNTNHKKPSKNQNSQKDPKDKPIRSDVLEKLDDALRKAELQKLVVVLEAIRIQKEDDMAKKKPSSSKPKPSGGKESEKPLPTPTELKEAAGGKPTVHASEPPAASGETAEEKTSRTAFATQVYDEIDSKIGGNGYNQFLCLLIPGMILDDSDYRYDLKKEIKGPVIEANECRLANRMFDPCQIASSDNGRNLAYQYKMALDMLTPKVNKRLALQKNRLRKLLISPYPYDFGDGLEHDYTLQEVYFRLYDEYMDEIYKWNRFLADKKRELMEQYPIKEEYENAYLEWYENNAEDYLDVINQKKSKVLTVFSPNDMKILEGILDSGSGAELQEARQNLYNYRKLTPSGGYIYPVSFEPANWFDMIGTSFTSAELMDSPEKIVEQIQRMSLRRVFLYSGICDICRTIGNDLGSSKLKPLLNSIDKYKLDVEKAAIKSSYFQLSTKTLIPILEILSKSKIQITDRLLSKLQGGAFQNTAPVASSDNKPGKTIAKDIGKDILKEINSIPRSVLDSHDFYLEQSYELTALLIRLVEEKEIREKKSNTYGELIKPLKTEIDSLNESLERAFQRLSVSAAFHDNKSEDPSEEDIVSPQMPKGFTKVEFETDIESLDDKTEYQTSPTAVSSGRLFLFNGHRSQKLETLLPKRRVESVSTATAAGIVTSGMTNKKCKVQVSMNVVKIGIRRDWFNPGVFSLTGDMFRLSESLIAPATDLSSEGFSKARLLEMQDKIFSCYPVSMVLARNMQIKFKYEEKIDEETRTLFEKHATSNGGFLIFRGRDENGNSDLAGVHTYFTDQTVTLTFDTTQVIGYYLQATAPDKSTFLDGSLSDDDKKSYSSMADFSENYRLLIDAAVKKRIAAAEADTKDVKEGTDSSTS